MNTRPFNRFVPLGAMLGVALLCGCGKKDIVHDRSVESAAGEAIGAKVAAAAPGGGTVVVLVQRGGGEERERVTEAYLEGLQNGLGESYTLKSVGPDLGKVKPGQEAVVATAMSKGWPMRAIFNWCRADRDAVAVVTLMPSPTPRGFNQKLLAKFPPTFILEPGPNNNLKTLASSGALRGFGFPKEKPSQLERKASPEEIFAAHYEYVSR